MCAESCSFYGSKVWHSNDRYRRVISQCNHKFDGNKKCATPHLTEDEIKNHILAEMTHEAILENACKAQNQDKYIKHFNSLASRYEKQKARHDKLESKIADIRANDKVMENFSRTLKETDAESAEFDGKLWSSLVDHTTVYDKDKVVFTFKGGTDITV